MPWFFWINVMKINSQLRVVNNKSNTQPKICYNVQNLRLQPFLVQYYLFLLSYVRNIYTAPTFTQHMNKVAIGKNQQGINILFIKIEPATSLHLNTVTQPLGLFSLQCRKRHWGHPPYATHKPLVVILLGIKAINWYVWEDHSPEGRSVSQGKRINRFMQKNWAGLMSIERVPNTRRHDEVDLYSISFSSSSLHCDKAAMPRYPLVAIARLESSTRSVHFLAVVGLWTWCSSGAIFWIFPVNWRKRQILLSQQIYCKITT